MGNILNFPEPKDFSYITGAHNEPDIVDVQGRNISLQLAPNLNDFLAGDTLVTREELIAFVLVTGLYDDIKGFDNDWFKGWW